MNMDKEKLKAVALVVVTAKTGNIKHKAQQQDLLAAIDMMATVFGIVVEPIETQDDVRENDLIISRSNPSQVIDRINKIRSN